jgi:hypothetical protein
MQISAVFPWCFRERQRETETETETETGKEGLGL